MNARELSLVIETTTMRIRCDIKKKEIENLSLDRRRYN